MDEIEDTGAPQALPDPARDLALLREAIRVIPIPVAIFDGQERLLVCSRPYMAHHPEGAERLGLWTSDARPTYRELVLASAPPDATEAEQEALLRSYDAGQRAIDGVLRERIYPRFGWVRIGRSPLPDGGWVVAAIEINELKAREAELEAALHQARASDRAKSKFLATMTHEVRTPLNGVIGLAEILLLSGLDERVRRNIEQIRSSGLHLLDLINRVLDFSRLDAGALPQPATPVDPAAMAGEVLAEARYSKGAAALDLALEAEPGLPPQILCDRHGLRVILTNLIGNAVKFTDRGSVRVRLAPEGGGVGIAVADTGIGIAADQTEAIFQPFVQADDSLTRRHGGTGLGLAICAELVRGMGGRIGVESRPGEGSTFRVWLPPAPP